MNILAVYESHQAFHLRYSSPDRANNQMYEENHNWKLGQLASFFIIVSWGAIRNELIKALEHYNVRIVIINQIKIEIFIRMKRAY